MNRVAVIARFSPEPAELVKSLLAAGPPYDLADTAIDRHAVFLSSREVVFVFEGPEVEWEVEDLADDFFNPEIRAALTEWRTLLEEEPRIGRPVFVWERGSGDETEEPAGTMEVADALDAFVRIAPEDTLGEAVERIVEGDGAPALVVDYGRLIGLLGAHDVLRAVAERVHPSDARVREWMSEAAVTVPAGLDRRGRGDDGRARAAPPARGRGGAPRRHRRVAPRRALEGAGMTRTTFELQPWSFAERPRVLIEHPDPDAGLELAGALRGAGYAVAICRGPDGTSRCPLHKLEPCAVVEGADVVVTVLDFEREEAREVLAGLRLRYPSTPLVVGATAAGSLELADELHGCTVVPVDAEPARVVDAVLAQTKRGAA